MRTRCFWFLGTCLLTLGTLGLACTDNSSSPGGSSGGSTSSSESSVAGGASGSASSSAAAGGSSLAGSSSVAGQAGGSSSSATQAGGTTKSTGTTASGGQTTSTGGNTPLGGTTKSTTGSGGQTTTNSGGTTQTGGKPSTTGGSTSSGSGGAAGGTTSSGTPSTDNGGCVPTKTWGTVDPTKQGPFEVATDKNVGPENGEPDKIWDNQRPHFNVYYPKDLSQGYCYPLITWGNGTGDQPEPVEPNCKPGQCGWYKTLITKLASHGFIVVASLSSQTAKGTPLPQVAGVDWMIKENADPVSKFYHKIDISKIGAAGHSQGGMATSLTAADPRIVASVPLCGARAGTYHGPALLLCGSNDTMVKCSSVQTAYDGISGVPVMLGELAGVDHGNWVGSPEGSVMAGMTGWMRVHLMNDTTNRGMFYGANCKVCSDPKWKVQRKLMDQ